MSETVVQASCHCGNVVIDLARKPEEVFECNCSICSKLGVLWSYYHCDEVNFTKGEDGTNIYQWNERILEFHSCSHCGCTTHWIAADKSFRDKMGVNARLIDGVNNKNSKVYQLDFGGAGQFWTDGEPDPETSS